MRAAWLTLGAAVMLGLLGLKRILWRPAARTSAPGFALFWDPVLKSSGPALLVLGVHSFDKAGHDISAMSHASAPQTEQTLLAAMTRSDMISLNDAVSYNRLASVLTRHGRSYQTQGAEDTTLKELGHGPVLLVGGLNNLWTMRLEDPLRFRFQTIDHTRNVIQDMQNPSQQWTLDTSQSALSSFRDYGIVSCFFDRQLEQTVMMVAGLGKSGTEAAAEFVSDEKATQAWFRGAQLNGHRNVEILVYTDVVEGSHGPPHVVDSYSW